MTGTSLTWEPLSVAFSARLGIFSARSAGSSRKLRLNSNHASKVNARPYWAYNRPIMPMYEHFVLPFASWVNNLLCARVTVMCRLRRMEVGYINE